VPVTIKWGSLQLYGLWDIEAAFGDEDMNRKSQAVVVCKRILLTTGSREDSSYRLCILLEAILGT